jgi:uncharacterized protein (UPF0264 family)
VSVRSAAEAREAIVGGCDILDVKEPRHGSLGAAPTAAICEVAHMGNGAGVPVSAALGECADWHQKTPLELDSLFDAELRFVKLGLAGMGDRENWSSEWLDVTDQCSRKLPSGTRHVAVIYADWQAARAPHPQSILEALSEHLRTRRSDTAFAGVLIDTFEKSSGRLLDAMSLKMLRGIRKQTSQMGLFLALAGRLNEESLSPLVELAPDIVAIRSAACRGEDRNASVDRDAVSQFRAAMQSHFEPLLKTAAVDDGARHA